MRSKPLEVGAFESAWFIKNPLNHKDESPSIVMHSGLNSVKDYYFIVCKTQKKYENYLNSRLSRIRVSDIVSKIEESSKDSYIPVYSSKRLRDKVEQPNFYIKKENLEHLPVERTHFNENVLEKHLYAVSLSKVQQVYENALKNTPQEPLQEIKEKKSDFADWVIV